MLAYELVEVSFDRVRISLVVVADMVEQPARQHAAQIVDDVLDLTAAEEVLGKPVASDLREGKATLAVIHALERGTGADREAIRTVLADRSFENVSHPEILEILHRHGSIDYAMDTACAYAEAARLTIADLPDSEAKRALLWVPGFVTTRDR